MSDEERDLRDALRSRADEVPVGRADEAGLLRRLAAARRRRQQARLAVAAAAMVLVLGAATLVAVNEDEPASLVAGPGPSTTSTLGSTSTTAASEPVQTSLPPAPTSSVPAATSTAPPTVPRTTTTAAPLPPLPDDALWPEPGATTTFSSPSRAATDFARRFLGMSKAHLGPPKVSGTNAAVDITPGPSATLTTVVTLRRVDVRGWVVVGCAAPSIEVDQPTAGATVTSPLNVRGRTQAFEGTVDVEVRRDGSSTPLGRSFGTGASDQMAPYEATVAFIRPSTPRGTVVVTEPNAEDGAGPLAATVIRIRF